MIAPILVSARLLTRWSVVCFAMLTMLACSRSMPTTPVQWDLSTEASYTYGRLLLDQSLRGDDHEGILEALNVLLPLETDPQPFIEAGAWLLINKYPLEARAFLEKAIQRFPSELPLHLLLVETWLEEKKGEEAVRVLEAFQARRPDSLAVKQELMILNVKVGRFQEASKLFNQLPKKMRTPYLYYCHAQALLGLEQPARAAQQLRLALEEAPAFREASFELAKILESQKQYKEAIDLYTTVLEEYPDSQDVRLRLIGAELASGHPNKALDAVLSGSESVGFQLTAVTLFLDEQCFVQAEALLERLKNQPNTPDEVNFYLAAVAYEYHKDVPQTLTLLAAVPETSRFYERALRLSAQLYYDSGQPDAALQVVRQGKELLPEDKEFRLMELHLLLTSEQLNEALRLAEEAISLWPDDEDLLYLRGTILDALGRKAEAVVAMELLISKNPDAFQALNYVGYHLAEQGRELDRALVLLERADRLQPNQGYILDSLAWALYRKGRVAEAWKAIRRAVRLQDGAEATIWEHYGDIALAAGEPLEARRGWKRALTFNPDNVDAIRNKLKAL